MMTKVDDWMAAYDNPMKQVVEAVRQVIMNADDRMDECIKWQAPTFIYNGNMASFFPKAKQHATLMFHKGATIKGDFPNLIGDGKEARTMKFNNLDDVKAKTAELILLTKAWCDQQSK